MKIFRIHFEDHGQDFLTWDVDIMTAKVVDCRPFQADIWCQFTVLNLDDLEVGGKVEGFSKMDILQLKYPIESIEEQTIIEAKAKETLRAQYNQSGIWRIVKKTYNGSGGWRMFGASHGYTTKAEAVAKISMLVEKFPDLYMEG